VRLSGLWHVWPWTAIEITASTTTLNPPAAYLSWLLRNCPVAPVVCDRGSPTGLFLPSTIYSPQTDGTPDTQLSQHFPPAWQHISIRRGVLTAILSLIHLFCVSAGSDNDVGQFRRVGASCCSIKAILRNTYELLKSREVWDLRLARGCCWSLYVTRLESCALSVGI
jgi:hypothetical protein